MIKTKHKPAQKRKVKSGTPTPEKVETAVSEQPRAKENRTKVLITLRLDPEIIEHYRATGAGYQTRINDALKETIAGK